MSAYTAVAAPLADRVQLFIDEQVIHCSADVYTERNNVLIALKDGIEVNLTWYIQVSRKRKYWLNDGVAAIQVSRRIQPDLLTRSWLLVDDASGITRRVYSLDTAMQFLFQLEQFPVLDRTLLKPAVSYRLKVKVDVHHGDINEAWWSVVWHPAQVVMQKEFQLP